MHVRRFILVPAVTMLTLAACSGGSGSGDQQARDEIAKLKTELAAVKKVTDDLSLYLGRSAQPVGVPAENVYDWQKKVFKAICNLEYSVKPDAGSRLCHDGDTDHGAPPKPPPFL